MPKHKTIIKIFFLYGRNPHFNKEILRLIFFFNILFFFLEENRTLTIKSKVVIIDLTSIRLIILTIWITNLIIVCIYQQTNKPLILTFITLALTVIFRFLISNRFIFYFIFEIRLLPILLLIVGWGYQIERLKAGLSLLFYTLFASLPLLLIIIYLHNTQYYGILFNLRTLSPPSHTPYNIFSIILTIAFFVKLPIYFFHLWLSKAHVEAPVRGSMFLAGILLKLGGYALLRLSPLLIIRHIKYFFLVTIIGGRILAFVCLKLIDIKVLIAYSSVVHIAILTLALCWGSYWGRTGTLIIIIAHGLCSAGIFAQANIIYLRSHSRNILLNKGILAYTRILSFWWFLFIIANFGGPFTFNLLREILLISSLLACRPLFFLFVGVLAGLSAAYCLILFRSSQQGSKTPMYIILNPFLLTESLSLFRLLWPLLGLCLIFINI